MVGLLHIQQSQRELSHNSNPHLLIIKLSIYIYIYQIIKRKKEEEEDGPTPSLQPPFNYCFQLMDQITYLSEDKDR